MSTQEEQYVIIKTLSYCFPLRGKESLIDAHVAIEALNERNVA